MPRKQPSIRVGNAELHGRRWRVAEIDATGFRTHLYFEGPEAEREAREYVAAFRAQAGERTVAAAVTEYMDHLARFGGTKRRPMKALRTTRSKLMGILRLVDPDARSKNRGRSKAGAPIMVDRPLSTLTPTAAQRLYSDRVDRVSPDTHHSELVYGNAFGVWCVTRGYLRDNPFEGVLPEGSKSRGKDQLRIETARAFIRSAYSDEHPLGGIAAAGVLTLGVRSNELLDRIVADLDDDGRVLWIPSGKTASAKRRLVIPPVLRQQLLKLSHGREPQEYLFGSMTDGTLLKHVARICEQAGVPVVTTHGLRGTQLSLTIEIAAAIDTAAKNAGHANSGVTRSHYLAAGVEASARAQRLEEILLGEQVDATELELAEKEAKAALAKVEALRAKTPNYTQPN